MDTDGYRHRFAEFLATQPLGAELSYEQVVRAQTRQELGITSLNMIVLLLNYIKKYAGGTVTLRPEWVLRLNDIDGITSVLRDIDATTAETSTAGASTAEPARS